MTLAAAVGRGSARSGHLHHGAGRLEQRGVHHQRCLLSVPQLGRQLHPQLLQRLRRVVPPRRVTEQQDLDEAVRDVVALPGLAQLRALRETVDKLARDLHHRQFLLHQQLVNDGDHCGRDLLVQPLVARDVVHQLGTRDLHADRGVEQYVHERAGGGLLNVLRVLAVRAHVLQSAQRGLLALRLAHVRAQHLDERLQSASRHHRAAGRAQRQVGQRLGGGDTAR
mmetsp:Transcript_5303/g.13426  ORF Transcript_5303/g.13426 Transcript_5303/m.13426 type:complete len:224 (+) Transcript_5303:810-1481(+)